MLRGIPGVKAAIATEDPVPAIVTFVEQPDDELYGDIGEAQGKMLRAHAGITPELRTLCLRGGSLGDYAISEDDLVYRRDVDGN